MSPEELITAAAQAVIEGDEEAAATVAREVIELGMDPLEVIAEGYSRGMTEVGRRFADEDISLPEVIVAADAMQVGMSLLEDHIPRNRRIEPLGTVVLGVAEGDMHDIGKRIVATMLGVNGFAVVDIGRDVPAQRFVEEAISHNADIVGCSALMTSTMVNMRGLENALRAAGLRDSVKTMIGGAATNQQWADAIGSDAWAENANEAVDKARELVGR